MIRPFKDTDRAAVLALLRAFHGEARMPFEPDVAYGLALIEAHRRPGALCLVLAVDGTARGILMAQAIAHPFGDWLVAKETIWFVDPDHRGRGALKMLDAYEAWARETGCRAIGMASLAGQKNTDALYLRRGYAPAETHYLKEL